MKLNRLLGLTLLAVLLGGLLLASLPAQAAILYNADTSGSVVVQSRRTLRDQERYSWQVIAFKLIQPDQREGEIALRLVGFPGSVEIDSQQPIQLSNPNGKSLLITNISDQIPVKMPQPHVGQYDLQASLTELPTHSRLDLHISTVNATVNRTKIILPISPALIEEWLTVVNTHYSDLVGACDQFPVEARQNPAFPNWIGCRQDVL